MTSSHPIPLPLNNQGSIPLRKKILRLLVPRRPPPGHPPTFEDPTQRPLPRPTPSPAQSGSNPWAFATMSRAHYPLDHRHPLLHSLNPHDVVPFMDDLFASGRASNKVLSSAVPERVLATHMPYSLLPDSITSSGCWIIYICRDPKDVVVSLWHFSMKTNVANGKECFPFDEFFDKFCEGDMYNFPIWDHSLEYWKESLRRPEKVLFLKYEEMLEEPAANVKRLAEFVRCPFSEEEEEGGVLEEIITLCGFEKLKSSEVNKTGSREAGPFKVADASSFRKGVGDWKNHMSLEMAQRLDGIVREKLEGSGLTIPGVGAGVGEATAGDSNLAARGS